MIKCGCDDCKHYEDGYCDLEDIEIDYILSAGGWSPGCVDYDDSEVEE